MLNLRLGEKKPQTDSLHKWLIGGGAEGCVFMASHNSVSITNYSAIILTSVFNTEHIIHF